MLGLGLGLGLANPNPNPHQTLLTEPSIDPTRLVLVGASMGAYGVLDPNP